MTTRMNTEDNTMRNGSPCCPHVGTICKYTQPADADEAALRFVVVEAAPEGTPPRVRIRPRFWPWQLVPEETVSPDDVTTLTNEEIAG
jgi:hypothetical protein